MPIGEFVLARQGTHNIRFGKRSTPVDDLQKLRYLFVLGSQKKSTKACEGGVHPKDVCPDRVTGENPLLQVFLAVGIKSGVALDVDLRSAGNLLNPVAANGLFVEVQHKLTLEFASVRLDHVP